MRATALPSRASLLRSNLFPMATLLQAYIDVALLASTLCFAAYGLDKRSAVLGQRRIRERTLHLLALGGGWPGALAGQRVFRHKTQKLSFRVVLWGIVLLHLALIGCMLWAWLEEPASSADATHRVTGLPSGLARAATGTGAAVQ